MGAPEHHHGQATHRPPAEIDLAQGLMRLEQQVSFNYNMIQGHHQDIARISDTVARMQHEMVSVISVMEEMRSELRARPVASKSLDPSRYDPADIEVLATQIASVTTKANEVDNLRVQIDLLRQRLKRFEGPGANVTPRPSGEPPAPARPDQAPYDAVRAQQAQQPTGLPSIRPGATPLPEDARQPGHPPAPVLESQPAPGFHPPHERPPGFRPAEPLPPPTALSGWRPAADSYPPTGGPPIPAHGHPLRSHPESEPQASGWAAVNGPKRPLDEAHPLHDSSQPGSPKRPKLAPLKPRSSFGDEHHQSPSMHAANVDPAHQVRGRIPSGEIHAQPHIHHHAVQAPAQGSTNSYRFITSTGQPDNQEHWRQAEGDPGRYEHATAGSTGRGRGRGSRGGRRGGRGRGARSSSGAADHPPAATEAPLQEQAQAPPPEFREHHWAAIQPGTSNGHYSGPHVYSPSEVARQPPADLGAQHGPPPMGISYPAGHEHEFPATPVGHSADPYFMGNDLDPNSASKKTRTKPIRNSDGVLIRKDGRPDMRSVSSANNLRKVHAKKEAEKAENDGRTPTSGRSLAPANSSSMSDDEGMEEGDYMEGEGDLDGIRRGGSEARTGTPGTQPDAEHSEHVVRHRELMNRMFHDSAAGPKGTAEAWFPRTEGPPLDFKREGSGDNKDREARWRGMPDPNARDSQPASEREASHGISQRGSHEQTPHEPTPNTTAASEPAASEQPDNAADSVTGNAPTPAADGEKEAAKKDSTQLQPGGEPQASEAVAGEAAAV